jgi:hypothetical protein
MFYWSMRIQLAAKNIEQTLEFMDMHTDAGGVGVRMLSPRGRFLTESRTWLYQGPGVFFKLPAWLNISQNRACIKMMKDWVEEESLQLPKLM